MKVYPLYVVCRLSMREVMIKKLSIIKINDAKTDEQSIFSKKKVKLTDSHTDTQNDYHNPRTCAEGLSEVI